MRLFPSAAGVVVASIASVSALPAPPAIAAEAYCPNRAHAEPEQTPSALATAIARAFQVDQAMARESSYVRCVGATLMGCIVGANLDCFKADTRRVLPGATAWCHDNPNDESIPMAATGHATIYEWSCNKGRAVPGKALVRVDAQGFIADNWKALR